MATDHIARQVFDLPAPQPLFVTEHRAHSCVCAACGAGDVASVIAALRKENAVLREQNAALQILATLAAQLEILTAQQQALIAQLHERIAQLERQLGLNSGNSGKPPSRGRSHIRPAVPTVASRAEIRNAPPPP